MQSQAELGRVTWEQVASIRADSDDIMAGMMFILADNNSHPEEATAPLLD